MPETINGVEVIGVSELTADAKAQLAGLFRVGKVTTATSVTVFASTDLIGQDNDAFPGWYVYVLQADNGAPENETQPMSDYISSTGAITHTAFTVQLAVGDWVVLLHPSIAMLGAVDTSAATGAVTSTDLLMAYVKQLVTNTYRLGETAIADTSDPVDMTTEVADDTILANMLTNDGDTSTYDRRTDSQEAISDEVAAVLAAESVLHTVFRTEDEFALKNTNLDVFGLDAIGGTCRNVVFELYLEKGGGGHTFTITISKTDVLRPTTYTSQLLPSISTIATPATDGVYRYEAGDLAEGNQVKFNIAQDNNGDANLDLVGVMTYEQ
ncbi:hypothetical protein LCGC14_0386120 [marine sediment metagenome]|uniref:Uncharacterized protein n=1 Tax=marine sediment metagenome TaxID=412755 RepID=A0A0F9W9U1_9ZZZZ